MATITEALAIGVQHHRAGRLEMAAEIYRRILSVEPDHADALHLLGVVAHQTGRHAAAIAHIEQAIRLTGTDATFHSNLGEAYRALQMTTQAVACYRRALELNSDCVDALYNLGIALHDQGSLDEAAACCRRSLELQPNSAEAHNNLANVLKDQGKLSEAIACYRRAIQLQPDYAQAHNNLGNAWKGLRNLGEATASYRRAIELKPDYAEAHNNLGNVFEDQGKLDEAVACHGRALELKPDLAGTFSNLGNVFKSQGKLDEAIACYRRAIDLQPDFAAAHSNILYALSFSPACDAQAIHDEARRWNQRHAEPLARFIAPHLNERSCNRRLRIGYVSSCFRDHCQALFTTPLLAAHDHKDFEIFCYADVACPDGVTAQLRSHADVWRDIAGLGNEQTAQLMRDDRIDILVGLTMHMAENRLLAFARKPAPVLACWLAYPGTTGLASMDYRITDPYLDPPDGNDSCYSEESVRLPDTFWCYDPLTSGPPVNALPALERGYLTFGSLNNFCKVNKPVLRLWARVLTAVERSRLVLLSPEGSHRRDVQRVLEREGVAPQRITFLARQTRQRYLELYHGIDLGLDTFPYNGHTTSLDSYWMGVPVVTMVGPTVVGRAGFSQLTNLGLTELVAETPQQFVSIAAALAHDLPRLGHLRATLRERMLASPLMDAPRFARNIEAAYRRMWQRWCEDGSSRIPSGEGGSAGTFWDASNASRGQGIER